MTDPSGTSVAGGRQVGVDLPPGSIHDANLIVRPRIRPVRVDYQRAKRILDVTLCILAMPLVLPVMALCAVFIWLENPRSILFKQSRPGRGGTPFEMLKFRTMVTNAQQLERELAHLNELTWPDFKISNDPRVTRVGQFLRKTSLDELPQLFNVLRGEMSLVGPRPTCFGVKDYALCQTERLEVLPGITGLWQVSGRSDLDLDDKLRLDVEYIERQSLWSDIKILFRTVPAVLSRRGAF